MKFTENFSQNLARLRKEAKLTQQELADALGVLKQRLSEFESNVCFARQGVKKRREA
jgi:transcriptional regulator with XRE-family HTH domain